jgi:hypothetical protein
MHRDEFEARVNERASRDSAFRNELVANPKVVLEREFGTKTPDGVNIQVVTETEDTLYLVLRAPSLSTNGALNDAQLEAVAGGGGAQYQTGHQVGDQVGIKAGTNTGYGWGNRGVIGGRETNSD